jgi:hypothetical protein
LCAFMNISGGRYFLGTMHTRDKTLYYLLFTTYSLLLTLYYLLFTTYRRAILSRDNAHARQDGKILELLLRVSAFSTFLCHWSVVPVSPVVKSK